MRPGDVAPEFDLPTQDGSRLRLSDALQDGPVVLFFYPRAMTPGCTKESCHFRDLAAEFAAAGAQRVGISVDDVGRQQKFADKHGFDFPLLSDPDRTVAKAYGVKRPGPLMNARATFVIGEDGRVVEVIKSEVNMDTHADKALAVLADRKAGAGT
ncbi:MAG: thioredoxin-dependent peroxiredoxin [Actinomycetota bacterium]|jgi:peroxiredoxin Q/BCP